MIPPELAYTVILNPDNTFSIIFDSAITQTECNSLLILDDQIASSFLINLQSEDRSNLEPSDPTLVPNYQGSLVESFNVNWTLSSTIRSKDQVNFIVKFSI